jgi:2-polyprenyl-3-methyl-5-hydroxy-6-metoxy-1,4-benzoquinol methylase
MELLTTCPLCKNSVFTEFLRSADYFLTKEKFTIVQCQGCGLKFVNPRPDEAEISRYYESSDYISHDSKTHNIRNFMYSMVRNYSLRGKLRLIEKYTHGRKILDIGCGTGEFLACCKKAGWEVKGIEPNRKPREFAIREHKVEVLDEIELASLTKPAFDVITLWHVLEHVHPLAERMIKIRQILYESGTVIIAVPNCNSWDANRYKNFWAAYDLPRHIYHFSQSTIKQLANNSGFEIEKIIPMKMDAFYISLLSEKYSKGYSNYFSALKNGILSNNFARKNKMEYSSLIFVMKARKTENKAL